jgi:hypothetical protein
MEREPEGNGAFGLLGFELSLALPPSAQAASHAGKGPSIAD